MDEVDRCSALRFACPRCGEEACDEYEVLDPLQPVAWRCQGCTRVFDVMLLSCERCCAEVAATALARSEQLDPRLVRCASCGAPLVHDVEVSE
jgi:uncharacterized Zn finger protein